MLVDLDKGFFMFPDRADITQHNNCVTITRFKGLGEISPDEFGGFIGEDIRLEPVVLNEDADLNEILKYYMGKNTQTRQEFIIDNLRFEVDEVDEEEEEELALETTADQAEQLAEV